MAQLLPLCRRQHFYFPPPPAPPGGGQRGGQSKNKQLPNGLQLPTVPSGRQSRLEVQVAVSHSLKGTEESGLLAWQRLQKQSENGWRGGSTLMRGCVLGVGGGVAGEGLGRCRLGKREGQEAGPTGKWKETLRGG